MERFENQLQARLVREQLRRERREARWAIRRLKLDLRSIKPVDSMAVERFKTSIKKPVVVKPAKKKLIEKIKSRLRKKRKLEGEAPKKPIVEKVIKSTTKETRYRCIVCGTISPDPGICRYCGKEMEEFNF